MSVIDIREIQSAHPSIVYVILGIDHEENDRVIAVRLTYDEAKKYCINTLATDDRYYDLWIEKHPLE
jgi:hypothetical protein